MVKSDEIAEEVDTNEEVVEEPRTSRTYSIGFEVVRKRNPSINDIINDYCKLEEQIEDLSFTNTSEKYDRNFEISLLQKINKLQINQTARTKDDKLCSRLTLYMSQVTFLKLMFYTICY